MIWVKLCGMTRPEDARAACALGIQAIGLVFHAASPRAVSVPVACRITAEAPPWVERVGVFVNESPGRIAEIAGACGLTLVQLHGDEPPESLRGLRLPAVKALRVRAEADLEALDTYAAHARFLLLDSQVPGKAGGTGERSDWALASRAAGRHRIVLAGGLTPANVGEAIRMVRPHGVDVSSGIESAPGRKDPERMREFVCAVRRAEAEGTS